MGFDYIYNTKKDNIVRVVTNFREREAAVNAVLFVHGFSGESTGTFDAIQNYILEDPKMHGWDMFPVGYSENVKPQMGKGRMHETFGEHITTFVLHGN